MNWTPVRKTAFKELKDELVNATLLAFPDPSAQFSVQTDPILQLELYCNNGMVKAIIKFFSERLTPAQCNYSAYDRELLAIYAAIKHFRLMLEGRRFYMITDHKTFAFAQKLDRASPRHCLQLEFISEYTTDIRYVIRLIKIVEWQTLYLE